MRIKHLFLLLILACSSSVISQTVDFDFTEVCIGNETVLTSLATSPDTDPILSWDWDLNDDGQFTDASGELVNYTFTIPGTYNIGLRIITESGYAEAFYQEVLIGSYPVANFSWTNACANAFTNFNSTSTIGGGEDLEDFIWDFGDDSDPNTYEANPGHWYVSPGFYTVELIAQSSLGCNDTISQVVEVNPVPTFDFQFDGDLTFDEGEQLIATAVGDFDQILWSTGSTSNSIVITEGGYYFAEVSNQGCPNVQSFTVIVNDRVGISKVMTPNGDGYNDRWEIYNIQNHSPCQVSIFSREGQLVYSNSNYTNQWNGTFNGKPLPEGTYFFVVNCNDGLFKKGSISIIR